MSHGDWKDMFLGVQNNDLELVQFYIKMGIDINYQHPEFMTSPLIESISCRHPQMTAMLLQNGASPTIHEAGSNKSPLKIARELKNIEAIKILNQYLESGQQNISDSTVASLSRKPTMKAAICTKYGGPEVLKIQEIAKPFPENNEILIKIIATAVNSGDVRVRGLAVEGLMKIIMRLVLGISKPRKPVLGTVYAGIVESVGPSVSKFEVGDKVFGMTGFNFGTYAEYVAVNEKSNAATMPGNTTFEEAVSLIFGGQTAIYFLEKAKIREKLNPTILIIGATGSVGTAAVQLAKFFGAEVTAVCSSAGLMLMKTLGVTNIILYDKDDFTQTTKKFDIIFDAVGKTTKSQCEKLLAKDGIYKTVGGLEYASESQQQLELIKELSEKGEYKAVIDKTFSLDNVVEAHQYVDTGRKKGNVILKISDDTSLNY